MSAPQELSTRETEMVQDIVHTVIGQAMETIVDRVIMAFDDPSRAKQAMPGSVMTEAMRMIAYNAGAFAGNILEPEVLTENVVALQKSMHQQTASALMMGLGDQILENMRHPLTGEAYKRKLAEGVLEELTVMRKKASGETPT